MSAMNGVDAVWRSVDLGPTREPPPPRPSLECELSVGAVRCHICYRLVERGEDRCELHTGEPEPWPWEIVG